MKLLAAVVVVFCVGSAHADPKRRQIEDAFARGGPGTKLTKTELRPAMKKIAPKLTRCYEQARAKDPETSGVVNTLLSIKNEPKLGLLLTVTGFDTHGPLGESAEFRACATSTFEATVWPAIKTRGTRDVIYPITFTTEPLIDKDSSIVDTAERGVKDARWADALAEAERGLALPTLDGPFRRRLIEVGGVAACHLKNAERARHYYALASPGFEERILAACGRFADL